MGKTAIEWTDEVWNPVTGCSKVSPGCKRCYAERVFPRSYARFGRKFTDVQTHANRLDQPLRWKRPRKIFVNSMSDLFHDDVPFEFIFSAFNTMAACERHTFQILTKRPKRMLEFFEWLEQKNKNHQPVRRMQLGATWPLPNVWLGVSVEDQKYADERIPILMQTPSAIRFVSYEPALGPVDFEKVPLPDAYFRSVGVAGCLQPLTEKETEPDDYRYWGRKGLKLDWVIVGGESGHGARGMDLDWVRSTIKQCQAAGVACFVKQLGRNPRQDQTAVNLDLDQTHGGNWLEWPEDLRVRQYPNTSKESHV